MREAMEIAREIVAKAVVYPDEAAALVPAIVAAIEKDRAETIERCARVVAHGVTWTPPLSASNERVSRETAYLLAKSVRFLSTPPRAEP